MANIEDYLKWRGDLSFLADSFNDVDNLLLCEAAYVDLRNIVPAIGTGKKISLKAASDMFFEINDEEELRKVKTFIRKAPFIMRKMAATERFGSIMLSDYSFVYDEEKQTQFAAFTAELEDDSLYIAFMGTDDTIIGWKEDFNMSFLQPVQAQILATDYVNSIISRMRYKRVRVGGHSKGGNLAIYSAVKAKYSLKRKIIEVYNNDGPGFDKRLITSPEYQDMKHLIKTIVPYHSVVGMLLEHDEKYIVVKSNEKMLMQHEPTSWQVTGNHFDTMVAVSKASKSMNDTISNWINNVDSDQRADFVESLFGIITASGATTLSEIQEDVLGSAGAAIKMYNSLDKEKKALMRYLLRSFTSEFDRVRKTKSPVIIKR